MAPVGLIDLAPEILVLIFSHFCSHCQYGKINEIPEYNTVQDFQNQAALAAMCLTHSSIRSIAQPILHHFFVLNATNLTKMQNKILQPRVASFIRTLAQRPDLGKSVRALDLHPMVHTYDSWKTMITPDIWKSLPEETYARFAGNAEIARSITLRHVDGRAANFGVTSVILLSLAPDLEYLVYEVGSFQRMLDLVQPPMTKLRVLYPIRTSQHMLVGHKLGNLFRLFPKIQALLASSATINCAHHFDSHSDQPKVCHHRPWEIFPQSLRKISWDSVSITTLGRIFDHCPLQDLELSVYINQNWAWELVAPPGGAFENLRATLRRLVVTSQFSRYVSKPEEFEVVTAPDGLVARAHLSLRQLKRLEILEIDQLYLHAELRSHTEYSAQQLSAVFPESLKALHVGYVVAWSPLKVQLQDLVRARSSGRLKSLSIVQADFWSSDTRESNGDDIANITATLASVGIRFFVGIASRTSRSLFPPPLGIPDALHRRIEFTLNDMPRQIS